MKIVDRWVLYIYNEIRVRRTWESGIPFLVFVCVSILENMQVGGRHELHMPFFSSILKRIYVSLIKN